MLKQGQQWRLGWKGEPGIPYPGLVGSDTWAIELTQDEFNDFCRLALELANTMAAMAKELMPEERIDCEMETHLVWLGVEGFSDRYNLRLILLQGRCGEGNWPEQATAELIRAIGGIKSFP
jgi:hypothetical protein